MSDQTTSGEPTSAPETAAGAAPQAAPASNPAPFGAFGNARGSGLSRGKRTSTPAAAPAASPASVSSYKPTSVEVITPQREYTNPFASEQPASIPANEPVAPAAPAVEAPPADLVQNTDIPVAHAPVTGASEPPAATAPAAGEPVAPPAEVIQPSVEKAEIKILPPAEAKRPAVSWGEAGHTDDRPARDERPTFRPDRRENRDPRPGQQSAGEQFPYEPREKKPFAPREPRDPRSFEPRDSGKPQDTRFPRRDPSLEQRGPLPREARDDRRPSAEPAKKSGGFVGWLKGLFGGAPEQPAPAAGAPNREGREGQPRDGDFRGGGRRRNRGGRGRGGYQGENRGPRDGQPRDPRDEQPRGEGYQGGRDASQGGERRFEGGEGGGRRRRRGGRGRYRDDRGGPAPEGQQGGGAI